MPWLRFTADYNHAATPAVTLRYPAGWTGNVTKACAELAIANGKAEPMRTPSKSEADRWRKKDQVPEV